MRLVKHLLECKRGAVHRIVPEQPLLDAIRVMAEKCVGALLRIVHPKAEMTPPTT
jgi:hypothetical protein